MVTARRLLFAVAVLSACTGLKSANETTPPPAAGTDAGTKPGGDDDDDTTGDGGVPDEPPDAGTPPTDFACEDEWTKPTKTRTECEARQVSVVEATGTIMTNEIAIAVTPAGRVGISYNTEEAVRGDLHLAHFIPKTSGFPQPELIVRGPLPYVHDGFRSRLVATAPDTLNVLTYDLDDDDGVGKVRSAKLVNGRKPLTDPEVAMEAIAGDSPISYAIAPDGTEWALARVATSASRKKVAAAMRAPGAAWTPLADLPESGLGLDPTTAPGIGGSAIHIDAAGGVHVLFHYNDSGQLSTPRYHRYAPPKWTARKTVDTPAPDGVNGFDPHLVTFGNRKYALFFYRKAIQEPPQTADLRLATWAGEDDAQIEIIDQGIAAPEQGNPRYGAAMAIDKFGLLHLVIVRPTGPSRAYLEYRRQQRVAGGGTKWLSDVVAPEVLSATSDAHVALTLDENARPHIAYRSGADGKVYYATRFDR